MKTATVLLFCGILHFIAAENSTKAYYDTNEINEELEVKMHFTKLDKGNSNMMNNLNKIYERQENQQNMTSIKYNEMLEQTNKMNDNLNKLNERHEKLENLFLIKLNETEGQQNKMNANLSNLYERFEKQEIKLTNLTGTIESLQWQINGLKCPLNYSTKNNTEWTVIQRRRDGSVDFYRNWYDYKHGFGNPDGEFFIGLECLHKLTTDEGPQELEIVMKDFEGLTRSAKYDGFVIGSEAEKYVLKEIGNYSGDAGDSLRPHVGKKFTTKDEMNDYSRGRNCAITYKGAWWFHHCTHSHLNGPYFPYSKVSTAQGIIWYHWRGYHYSLKSVEMKIRPATSTDEVQSL